ncbi:Uncharacterised protein [Klebsiella pneumoniae]|nr:Uncharacterised protein [Klebsiella pneumoniae]
MTLSHPTPVLVPVLQYRPERQLVRWPQCLEQSWWVLTYLLQERGNKGDG